MKIKNIVVGSFVLLLNILVLNPSTTYAASLDEQVITIDNTMSLLEQNDAINEFESNPDITELIVLDETLLEDDSYIDETLDDDTIQTKAITNQYRITGVSTGSDYTGGAIATTSGGPGINLAISQTKSVATTISASFGASAKVLNAGIGWNTTGSTSISISGSYKVPSKVGTKQVKTGTLKAHTVYKTKNIMFKKWLGILLPGKKVAQVQQKKHMGLVLKKPLLINKIYIYFLMSQKKWKEISYEKL